ncbi:MAG: M23 family metallopeptidase [Clostridia bacterium]|nr:M23 family metallopeptidase [Clostridia bacterium]
MDIKFKKASGFSLIKAGIYTAVAVFVAASGIGTYSFIRKSMNAVSEHETSIDWDNQGGRVEADVPATKVTVPQTEEENVTQETTAKPENLPFTGSFALPMGTEILKDYSKGEMVSSKTMGDWRVHNGIDFTGTESDNVFAIQSGKVTDVYDDPMWGVVIEIDHGNTMTAKYCGFKSGTTVKKGDTVKKGGTLGQLGIIPVEQADKPHLHLEITVNGVIVDPLAAMNRAS